RPLVFAAFRPDASAVTVDDALNVGQADAGAFKIAGAMQPLEDAEKFVGVLHVEAGSVVPDKEDPVLVGGLLGRASDLDAGLFPLAGVFDGVADEIGEDLAQEVAVGLDDRKR